MQKLKVMTIVGTRPEIIRLSRIIAKLDAYCEHTLVHTGQNYDYELNQIFFDDLGIRTPDVFLECAGSSAAETMAQVISKSEDVFVKFQPDALLILGDTNSALAAITAKRNKIPIFHMEAGNRCFDLRVPEEINRKIVDHIADVNMPYSDIAREYLIREGLRPDLIIKTGSPMDEVLTYYHDKIRASVIVQHLSLTANEYFLVSVHREENVDSDKNIHSYVQVLNELAEKYKYPIIVSTHPRTRKKIEALNLQFHPLVNLLKPLGFSDYVRLQMDAKVVLSDSGTITEESSILNFPALNIREAQERPEGFEEGVAMFTGMSIDRILQAINILESQPRGTTRLISKVSDYIAPNVSDKVLRIILSYTDYVNRVIWRKSL
ncbi:UDP-N-acetylglucosamine 2-epimerase (non-hydrolyzing) [Escherichia coli]|uniref:Non-hydrolyzing UDP-N-acetylglucosamine 2-epimerase n=3 Tax=Escherichia coli TaxID=562 RepID=A0ACD5GBA1_ECOLX|nr:MULTISPECIES: UDP-N-acetylglucosamine 2-epimerase (non-hydrolyzing) [Escherichia]EEQ3646443.1 UDP-N-acetylglucosamine 2-epimerase (non-hydrolyzing) [Escherichia coli]EER3116822.1 UDP-N-acetylglucosamine 2-epimerase (non-hydrolyzing) [Escherichia coli]EER6394125.1 UDP-N-acetylglucosamine 2-epimerase (non-hydrolyzing) [Escherichia coli]EER6574992.1 UDP-N-acetylglucosamine 2-epimerase (non-hydrolyzing) [Escherichia coli]EEU0373647.1 UDP-N-acetylglucosamine 2-epimerase (non-hydrolyzing) [Escher